MTFDELRLAEPILRAVRAEGYTTPTPIQGKAIPHVLEGRDLLACAQTGTGKTAAFALPILQRQSRSASSSNGRHRPVRVLVLAPTRELAAQIGDSFKVYGRNLPLRHAVIFGGVNQNPQARALRDGVDILVATPGRLLDLMEQSLVDLRHVEVLVLDEADRMLDMGFIRDIRKIVAKVPAKRQTLLFSATMPADIRELAGEILSKPVSVNVAPVSSTAETVAQSVFFVEKKQKPDLLEHFLNSNAITRALVFTRTKHGADRVARHLSRSGIAAEAIHGNKSQNARLRAISRFKSSAPPVLVATDIAARGLDIDEVSHVINFDVPNVPETYVHRIGRTGRAGASGLAVSFCSPDEVEFLRDIERLIRKPVPVSPASPEIPPARPASTGKPQPPRQDPSKGRRARRGRGGSDRTTSHRGQATTAPAVGASTEGPAVATLERPRPAGVGFRSRGKVRGRRGAPRGR